MGKILSVREMRAALPRLGFGLMLDRAEVFGRDKLSALKVVTVNEELFNGHFPEHPILPGVLQIEMMKQLSELSARPELAQSAEDDIYIAKLEKVKFRRPVTPGDRLRIDSELIEETADSRRYRAKVRLGADTASEAFLTLKSRRIAPPTVMPPEVMQFDKSAGMVYDTLAMKKLMPHRYPFLFIDYIAKQEGDKIVAVKNVSANDSFFRSAPDNAAVPESLLCEMGAQAGCACVLSRPENAGKLGFFMAIDSAESLAPIIPGDQMEIHVDLPPSKGRFGKGSGEAIVCGEVRFRITLMFAIVDP